MYETYRYIFFAGLALSILCLAVSVFIFFFLNIKDAIGDITGSNRRKAIEKAKAGKTDDRKKAAPADVPPPTAPPRTIP